MVNSRNYPTKTTSMKNFLLICLFIIPGISFSQWKIELKDDGFSKLKLIYTDVYKDPNLSRSTNKNCLAISGTNLIFLSNAISSSGSCFLNLIFIVNGQEKTYSAYDSPGFVQSEINGIRDCLFFKGYLKGAFLSDFLNANEILIKADCNSRVYPPVIFKLKLVPSETQNAWNENTNGKYFEEKASIEKAKTEQENLAKEQARQKEVQKQMTYELVQSNLKEKKVKEAKINFTTLKALLGYDLSDKKYADLELMILDQEKKNKQEIETLVKEKNIDAAIDLIKITSDEPSIQESIKLAILERYPNPTTALSSSELNDLLQGFNEKLSPSFQQNANQELSLLVRSDGACEIKNLKGELINSFKCAPQYIAELDYRGIKVNVDANYSLKISVDCGSAKVVRVNLGNSFSKERDKIENGELQFYYTADKEGTLILFHQSDGTPYTSEDKLVIKIDEARVVEGLIGKKAKFERACLIKVNGNDFTEINVESDVELTRFKKIK
jgi:hypothetical protein